MLVEVEKIVGEAKVVVTSSIVVTVVVVVAGVSVAVLVTVVEAKGVYVVLAVAVGVTMTYFEHALAMSLEACWKIAFQTLLLLPNCRRTARFCDVGAADGMLQEELKPAVPIV